MKWIILSCFILCVVKNTNSRDHGCAKIYVVDGCSCSTAGRTPLRLVYRCHGNSFLKTQSSLPNITRDFEYIAHEEEISFGAANFTHLTELHNLTIAPVDRMDRKLILLPNQTHVLQPLKNLRVLVVNVIWELSFPMPELLRPLHKLQTLDISYTKRVNISSLTSTLYGLENTNSLSKVSFKNIQTLDFATRMGQLHLNFSQLFHPLRHQPFNSLDIGYNAFQVIHPGINIYAKNLNTLRMGNNMLTHFFASSFFIDIITHPHLKSMELYYQGLREVDGQFDRHKQKHVIEEVVFSMKDHKNKTSMLASCHEIANPETASTRNCSEAMRESLCHVFDDICNETRAKIMANNDTCTLTKTLMPKYFNDIPCEVIPPLREMLDKDCAQCFILPTVGRLQQLYLNDLNIYDDVYVSPTLWNKRLCFHRDNHFNLIDLSQNNKHSYTNLNELIQADIKGLDKLTVLKIGQTGLNELNTNLGTNFPNLQMIDVSENQLTFANISAAVFQGMSELKYLDLSCNRIKSLDQGIFSDLNNLTTLNMSNNYLEEIDAKLDNSTSMRNLDLSNNLLETLPWTLTNFLNQIAPTSKNGVHLYITNNNFFCICDNKDFIEWMLFDKHEKIDLVDSNEIMCTNKYSRKIQMLSLTRADLRDMCRGDYYYIYLSVGISVPVSFLIFASCLFLYQKRWWFRYQVFLSRQLWKKYQDRHDAESNYRYDAFVSYNDRDHFWVDDVLRPTLEEEHGIRLCLHLRDFMFGGIITDQIIESIENSRRTMLILSPNFLASTWCHFEMQMAQHKLFSKGKDVLLLVLLKPLPKVGVSKMLKTLLETKTYIEWTEDEYGQKLFWAKLVQSVKAAEQEPYDVDIEDDIVEDEQRNLVQ